MNIIEDFIELCAHICLLWSSLPHFLSTSLLTFHLLFTPTFTSIPHPRPPSRLLACLGEESGHNLIADLSRTQQLVEVLETGFIFNSKRYVRTCASGNNIMFYFTFNMHYILIVSILSIFFTICISISLINCTSLLLHLQSIPFLLECLLFIKIWWLFVRVIMVLRQCAIFLLNFIITYLLMVSFNIMIQVQFSLITFNNTGMVF